MHLHRGPAPRRPVRLPLRVLQHVRACPSLRELEILHVLVVILQLGGDPNEIVVDGGVPIFNV